jgi:tetratricopeptide (TPR) repeat protein
VNPKTVRIVLPLVLLAGAVAVWALRPRVVPAPTPAPARPAPVSAPVPQVVERHAVTPTPSQAAPRPPPVDREQEGWIELNNAATTDLTVGDLVAAVEKLERCHAAVPGDAVFANNLAEALVRLARDEHERGKLAEAIAHLARAIEIGRAREDLEVLEKMLARWKNELELEKDDTTDPSRRFELTYDPNRSDILHHNNEVLNYLEQAYVDLVSWFGVDPFPSDVRIRVLLYDPADFDRLTGLGDWAAGVFDGAVRVSVSDVTSGSGWRQVLVHELVHAFVNAIAGPNVPGWLNEGLAQLLEGRPGESQRMRTRLGGAELFPLETLAGSLASWSDREAIARAYAESYLFVEYLRTTYGDESLRRTFLGMQMGKTPAAAFEAWSAVPLALAFEDWSTAFRR